MIFADKLIQLRKKSGWSQEELAEKMNVTRQSVSKWEGAQSIPDLDKIIRLSEIFGVTTDYLLKDEIEEREIGVQSEEQSIRRVTMEEANEYLRIKDETRKPIALGVFLCIISPIALLILIGLAEKRLYGITEDMAVGLGIVALLPFVITAVAIFIKSGSKTSKYQFLEEEAIDTEYGVIGMVNAKKEEYKDSNVKNIVLGVTIIIISIVPIFIGMIINSNDSLVILSMVGIMMLIAGIGVYILVSNGIKWAGFEKLLQQGDYTREEKAKNKEMATIAPSYWLIVTAIYLAISFVWGRWDLTWIIFAVAGVLFPVVASIYKAFKK